MMCNKATLLLFFIPLVLGHNRSTLEELTETCLDAKHHKSKPGPENSLFGNCSPWKDRSCCTYNTSVDLHKFPTWLNMNFHHCGNLSSKCSEHFRQDLCFFQCSPNVGPWLEPVNKKLFKEKFMHAPLCESDCNNWWNDCKDDFTCIQNWGMDFNWTKGANYCPTGKACRKFTEIFQNSTNFCQVLWNYSWKVVPDSEPCMRLWFNAKDGNPNDKVALLKAKEILGLNKAESIFSSELRLWPIISICISFLGIIY